MQPDREIGLTPAQQLKLVAEQNRRNARSKLPVSEPLTPPDIRLGTRGVTPEMAAIALSVNLGQQGITDEMRRNYRDRQRRHGLIG